MAGSISLGFMDARLKKAGSIETLPVKTRLVEAGPVNFGSIEALPVKTRPGEAGPVKAGSIKAHFRYCRCCCLALRHCSCQQALPGKARPGEAGPVKTHKTDQNFPSALTLNRNAFPGPGSEA